MQVQLLGRTSSNGCSAVGGLAGPDQTGFAAPSVEPPALEPVVCPPRDSVIFKGLADFCFFDFFGRPPPPPSRKPRPPGHCGQGQGLHHRGGGGKM